MLQRLVTAMPDQDTQSLALTVRNISKRFGNAIAVQGVSISIEPGEIAALLGPSGCGKTTVLRMIAGLQEPDEGEIRIGGQIINSVPVWERNIGMVFQNYALFPHMTVAENVGFGLRVRSVPAAERRKAVVSALDMVRLGAVAERLPSQLSGGQRQRVALARALVTNPRLLLLDEPLGALDRKLREQMQLELKLLQRRIGITTVIVTHDQEEALTLSDRIIVMNAGQVVQVGTPESIYQRPDSGFIADFIGTSNFFNGTILATDNGVAKVKLTERLVVDLSLPAGGRGAGAEIAFFIRPENLSLIAAPGEPGSCMPGRVLHVAYSGAVSHCYVDIGLPQPVAVLLTNNIREVPVPAPSPGDEVLVGWAGGGVALLSS